MGHTGMSHAWYNIGPKGRKGEMKGENLEVHCVLGVEVVVSFCDRKKGSSRLALCIKYFGIAVSEDRLVKGVYTDDRDI